LHPFNSIANAFAHRSTVLQTLRVDFARLRPFASWICARSTVSQTLRVDFPRERPYLK